MMVIWMMSFRYTINPIDDEYNVSVQIDKYESGKWKMVDYYITTSQSISSTLIWEKEKASEEVFNLEIVDNRPYFTMV